MWASLPPFLFSLFPLIAIMGLVALVEVFLPLHARNHGGRRVRVNLSLMALTVGLSFLLNSGLIVFLAHTSVGNWAVLSLPDAWWSVLLVILVLDFATWLAHVGLHKIPFLWRVHLVHHTDPLVDVTTSFRQHPGEGLWRFFVISSASIAIGAPPEAVALYRSLSAINALFEHGNLRVIAAIDRWFSPFWVTPNFHKLHHSSDARETDTNYGNLLSLFDRVFRTYTAPSGAGCVVYGISSYPKAASLTFRQILRLPFVRDQ